LSPRRTSRLAEDLLHNMHIKSRNSSVGNNSNSGGGNQSPASTNPLTTSGGAIPTRTQSNDNMEAKPTLASLDQYGDAKDGANQSASLNDAKRRRTAETAKLVPGRATESELVLVNKIREGVLRFHERQIQHIIEEAEKGQTMDQVMMNHESIQNFVNQLPKAEQSYFGQFFRTQIFDVYSHKIQRTLYERSLQRARGLIEQFQAMLEQEEAQRATAASLLEIYKQTAVP